MKLILVASLLLCLVVVSLQVAADNADQQTASDLSSPRSRFRLPKLIDFDSFKQMFNKHYTGILENLRRKKLFIARAFKAAISAIGYKHRERSSYLKINSMSDWTDEELKSIKTPAESLDARLVVSSHPSSKKVEDDNSRTVEMLPEVDLRNSGCLSQAKSQGNCGSCYIFATLALHEFAYCKESGKLVEFSEQFLLDCGKRTGMRGCNGGNPDQPNVFVRKFGLMQSPNYIPYSAKVDTCLIDSDQEAYFAGRLEVEQVDWKVIEHGELREKLNKSPVLTTIHVSNEFDHYGGGIHFMSDCFSTGYLHSVAIVGYGKEEGQDYWLVKNSYGTSWGEFGFYKLAASNKCFFSDQHLVIEMKFRT